MKREDLASQRPWTASPERDSPDSAWQVTAPRRFVLQQKQLIASLLSEQDARTIAAAPALVELLESILQGATHDEVQVLSHAIAREHGLCVASPNDVHDWEQEKGH